MPMKTNNFRKFHLNREFDCVEYRPVLRYIFLTPRNSSNRFTMMTPNCVFRFLYEKQLRGFTKTPKSELRRSNEIFFEANWIKFKLNYLNTSQWCHAVRASAFQKIRWTTSTSYMEHLIINKCKAIGYATRCVLLQKSMGGVENDDVYQFFNYSYDIRAKSLHLRLVNTWVFGSWNLSFPPI